LKNEIKPVAKESTSNPKNEHENDQISICRKNKNKKIFKEYDLINIKWQIFKHLTT